MSIIHHMNLAGIDLNLLVVFDALMQERHVTRAGEKLGLSQPATSNALARLRLLFEDELLVKTSEGMQPTPRAIALAAAIRLMLLQLQAALTAAAPFVPAESDRTFSLGMSDYTAFALLPALVAHLATVAPGVQIRVLSTERHTVAQLLDADEIDLAIGFLPQTASWHRSEVLFHESFVALLRQGHPTIGDRLTLDKYLAADHLLVSLSGDMTGRVDTWLAQQHQQRRVAITVPHFLVAPFILAQTDLIATLAERVAQTYAELLGLKVMPLPFELTGFAIRQVWHSKNQTDPASTWLRQTLKGLTEL